MDLSRVEILLLDVNILENLRGVYFSTEGTYERDTFMSKIKTDVLYVLPGKHDPRLSRWPYNACLFF